MANIQLYSQVISYIRLHLFLFLILVSGFSSFLFTFQGSFIKQFLLHTIILFQFHFLLLRLGFRFISHKF